MTRSQDITHRLWKLAPHSINPTDAILIEDAAITITALREKLGVACDAFQKIAAPLHCGCNPCTSSCRSALALQCEIEARQDIAIAVLASIKESTHE